MDYSLLARRYAMALYEYAEKQRQGTHVLKVMKLLATVWKEVPEFKKALEDPMLEFDQKMGLLRSLIKDDDHEVCMRFFQMVVNHNRVLLLGRMARAYVELWNEKHNIVRADLITVGQVGEHLSTQLEALVQKAVGDKKVEFNRLYNPDIIGGFVMQVDDLRIDASVRRELEQIKMNLLQ